MEITIQLTPSPIAEKIPPLAAGAAGAWVEFRGVVRGVENGENISALEYEAYPEMAIREIRRLLENISTRQPCLAARVIHRTGIVPVGAAAIYTGIAAKHRAQGFALLAEFMDRLKQDVPIWKRRALPVENSEARIQKSEPAIGHRPSAMQLDEAMAAINSRCQPLPPMRVALEESFGRVLRETVCAPEDLPPFDCSTRDGFAILADDASANLQVVDTIHAAGWQPRQLQSGESVRVATGAPLPCGDLRVVMQENVERHGDQIKILKREAGLNIRSRGEDVKAGVPLVKTGSRLNAGKSALLATVGRVQPLVSPRLRVVHFTTGDEIVSPHQTPKPGQIRDSNSILIRGLLGKTACDVTQRHLPENFAPAQAAISAFRFSLSAFDLVLVSGGASVGDKDFTRPLLEWLGFEIIFSQVDLRPGRPLIFGVNGNRVAFGLPGNPLSHFACFHFAVAMALAKMSGETTPAFLRGKLAAELADARCPRETLWPARWEISGGEIRLHPLPWASSGDVTCLAAANALLRVPANYASLVAGMELDFLPADG